MEKKAYLFYEDAKKQKKYLLIYSIVFYVGAAIWTFAVIIFSLLFPKANLELAQTLPTLELGISLPFMILCWVFASFGMLRANSKRFMTFTAIAEDKIYFFMQGEFVIYDVVDLEGCEFVKQYLGITEYKLQFVGGSIVTIATKKSQALKDVLNGIISSNKII